MVKSKFKIGYVFWSILLLLNGFGITILLKQLIEMTIKEGFSLDSLWIILFFGLLIFEVIFLKDFKYLQISSKTNKIKYFSLLRPFGWTLNRNDFKGKIKESNVGKLELYETAYLIDNNDFTSFKIKGLFYKNFDELYEAIDLVEIKRYDMNLWLYIKLLCTGRMKIKSATKKVKRRLDR
jgi:hypothetical protein